MTLPDRVAQMYLDMSGEWHLPPLGGVSTAPLLSSRREHMRRLTVTTPRRVCGAAGSKLRYRHSPLAPTPR